MARPRIPSVAQGFANRHRATFATGRNRAAARRFSNQLLHLKISVDYYLYAQLLFLKLKPPKSACRLGGNHAAESGIR